LPAASVVHYALRSITLLSLILGLSLVPALAQDVATGPYDVVIINARIYTLNPQQPWAEALAIRGDKIVAVGTSKEINAHLLAGTKVIDAKGQLVLPGFTDCHIHFMEGSLGLTRVDLIGTKSVEEIQKKVKDYASAHPNEPWVTGAGWTYPTFGAAALPDKKFLDEVVSDRPVFLVAFDGHSSWANSKALSLAGITRETPDPPNGKIVRDSKGEATGALKESAGDLVGKFVPKPRREERLAALRKGRLHFRLDGEKLRVMTPSKRSFTTREASTTEAALLTRGASQLYISLGDTSADGALAVRIYHKPLVLLIWWGPVLMAFGGMLSLSDRRLRVGAPKPAKASRALQAAE